MKRIRPDESGNPDLDDHGRRFFDLVEWIVYFGSRAENAVCEDRLRQKKEIDQSQTPMVRNSQRFGDCPSSHDSTLQKAVPIWVVCVDDDLYVRSY